MMANRGWHSSVLMKNGWASMPAHAATPLHAAALVTSRALE
jgi:hypothetical protein